MSRAFSALIFKALAVCIAAAGLSVMSASLAPVQAQDVTAKAAAARALAGTVGQRGRVSVIVRLSGDFRSEHELAGPDGIEASAAVAAQRARIGQAQTRVLSDLSGTSVRSVKRFRFVPFIGMSVDSPGLDALVRSPNVASIQEDRLMPPTLFQSVPLIGGDVSTGFPFNLSNFSGAGQMVAIIDTGVESTHPFLAGKVLSEACYSTNDPTIAISSVCPGGVTASTAAGSGAPCLLAIFGCDHGTHVAGIAAGQTTDVFGTLYSGVAKDASILAIQVFTRVDDDVSNGFLCSSVGLPSPCALTADSDQILGLERVYALRTTFSIAAANMSLGGGFNTSFCDSDVRKPIIDLLRGAGIATVIASGNNGFEAGVSTPGCISSAVTVGSSTKTDTISSFSNNSFVVDLLAPGEAIGSSVPLGSFDLKSGTSMATPHVTGAFAVLKSSNPTATVSELETALRSTGTVLSETRFGVFFSKPRINVDLALAFVPTPGTGSGVADFNADSMSDILFRNSGDGRAVIWQMNGLVKASAGTIGSPSLAWQVEDIGDSNSDGRADILWRNSNTGALSIWLMDGFIKTDAAQVGSVSTVWKVKGLGDFDGDGNIDILWHNSSTGSTVIWMMNGFAKVSSQAIGSPPLAWEIVGIADFNADAMSDILWRNSDGRLVVWQMNGFLKAATPTLGTPGASWVVEGVGDFDGGGQPDILFRNSGDDRLVIWQMNSYVKESAAVVGIVSSAWKVVRLGDHNGDGLADILWNRLSDGSVVIWQMNGLAKGTSGLVGAPAGWIAQ